MKGDNIINQNMKSIYFTALLMLFNLIYFLTFAQNPPWVSPKEAGNIKNPLVSNTSVLADAKALYVANCAPCHGDKGRGDGPAAPGLNPKPADHSSVAVQNETDGSLFWKLSEGRAPMPGYKKIFSDNQRWELIIFIRTLARSPKKK
jgi:mono/diheme cytochrome c family protein